MPEKPMKTEKPTPRPADAAPLGASPAAFRRQHHPWMIALGMLAMVTLAFVLGSLSR